MSDPFASNRQPSFPPGWVGYLVALQLILSVPMLLGPLTPWRFLPSPAWADKALVPALVMGFAFAAVIFWARRNYSFTGRRGTGASRKISNLIAVSAIWFAFGYLIVLVLVPLADAVVFGQYQTRTFVVSETRLTRWYHLIRVVEVEDLLLLSNQIYHVLDELLKRLRPGMAIIVSGRGTARGLFVDDVRAAD